MDRPHPIPRARFALFDAYRKFRSLLRRPLFQTVAYDAPTDVEDDDTDATREAPDVSHVAPPPAELPATRDEALEEFSRRLDVFATRADRLERTVEKLSPVQIADMPSRAELRTIELLANSNRERGEQLERRLAETRGVEAMAAEARAADRATMSELTVTVARLEAKLRDATEQLHEARDSRTSAAESLRELREAFLAHDAARSAQVARRLAGAYTVAVVALLASLLTLGLLLTR